MMYDMYYCSSCNHFFFVEEGPYERCSCGSLEIRKIESVCESKIEQKREELKSQGKKVY